MTKEEKIENIIENAVGSAAFEGKIIPEQVIEISRRMLRGEITREEALEMVMCDFEKEFNIKLKRPQKNE